jgi:hypothetical protein
MSVFTVHAPPLRAADAVPDPERIAFVRDGFSFWAFLFTVLWMARYRMWLVLLIYVVVVAGVETALRYAGVGAGGIAIVALLISLLIGLESGTLRRFALARRGWRNVGVVTGEDMEDAERRFFDAWAAAPDKSETPPRSTSVPPVPPPPSPPGAPHSPEIVGLFPEPGANR